MFSTSPLLLLTFSPLLFALGIIIHPLKKDGFVKILLFSSLALSLLYSLGLWATYSVPLTESYTWLPSLGISLSLTLDSLSLAMIVMTSLVSLLAFLGLTLPKKQTRLYSALFLFLQTGLFGTFLASDLFVFYLFWEAALIPMLFITGMWGGEERFKATIKFFLYTLVGSFAMLLAIIYLVVEHKNQLGLLSSDYSSIQKLALNPKHALYLFWAFSLAFLIKIPQFPLHNWQPELYKIAPPQGAIFLSALMAKMGTYGLLRFSLGLFPQASHEMAPYMVALALTSIIYGAYCAWSQTDTRKLIAYSSMSHAGFIVLGLFTLNIVGTNGAIFQMFNHALLTCGLFFILAALHERTGTYTLGEVGGLAKKLPWLSIGFFILILSSVALPGTNSFAGEFPILLGSFSFNPLVALLAGSGVIWGALYSLKLYRSLMLGESKLLFHSEIGDLKLNELFVLIVLSALIFIIGFVPSFFFSKMQVLP